MKTFGLLLVGILIGGLFVGTVYFVLQNKSMFTTPSPSPVSSPTSSIEPQIEEQTGVIEGSIGYPSEVIPTDLTVCAEEVSLKKEYCTTDKIEDQKYTYRIGFMLDVPPGEYTVYARRPDNPYRAYYNEFVTCGLSVACTSHQPIPVTVTAGLTTSGIDPQDWYNQPAPTE